MHHIRLRCGLSAFFQRLPHRLVRERVHTLQLDHPPCQQAQAPPTVAVRRRRAGQGDQVGLLLAVQLPAVGPPAAAVRAERRRQALLDEPPAQTLHGGEADVEGLDDPLVRPARPSLGLVRLEQDLGVLELAHVRLAAREQPPQPLALLAGQRHPVPLHRPSPVGPHRTNGSAHPSGHA
jgi:hypothetical protein